MKYLFLAFAALFISCGADRVSMAGLLDEMTDYDNMCSMPREAFTTGQVSSYDRRSVSPDQPGWFANADGDGHLSADTVGGVVRKVLFDEAGPGAITRIWITTLNKTGKFKFYFDGEFEPRWVIQGYDFGKTGLPIDGFLAFNHTHYKDDMGQMGGNTLFLPIPYAERCRIVFEYPVDMPHTPRYYQINYRRYDPSVNVETFAPEQLDLLAEKLDRVRSALLSPQALPHDAVTRQGADIAPGHTVLVKLPAGENAVKELRFGISAPDSLIGEALRQIVLKMTFDGKESVRVPLSDFSGGGFGAPAVKSWPMESDGRGNIVCRWGMPYRNTASLSLDNFNDYAVEATVEAYTKPEKWNDDKLYFHCSWRRENGIPLSINPDADSLCREWNFITLEGRGVYRADLLTLYNHAPRWYGEGDEKIWVDDDRFPSHFGTGTEDYYNCSFAPVVPFHTPFGGAPRADEESSHGYNSFYRVRNLDCIPFRKKLKFDLEMLSWEPGTADYSTTVFWYGDKAARALGTSDCFVLE